MTSGQKSALPVIGGILLCINSLMAIISGIYGVAAGAEAFAVFKTIGLEDIGTIIMVISVIFIVIALFVGFGGVMAIMRKKWGVALAASIVGIFLIGFWCTGTLVAIAALILIAVGKKHFN